MTQYPPRELPILCWLGQMDHSSKSTKYKMFNRLYDTFILYNCYTVLHSRVASSSSVPRRAFIELDYAIYDRIRNRALNNHAGVDGWITNVFNHK